MVQKQIVINEVVIPIIEEGGETWYPVSYIGDKVLLKTLTPNQLIKNKYEKYIRQFYIDYGEHTGGIQFTYCISEKGLKQILLNCKIGRLSVEQKKAMKKVCSFIGLNLDIDTEEKIIDSYSKTEWSKYDFWLRECIKSVLSANPEVKWQRCSKCGKYLPYNSCFFPKEVNKSNKQPLRSICNECSNLRVYHYGDKKYTEVYYDGGRILYDVFRITNGNVYIIYDLYNDGIISKFPSILHNSVHVINIINKYYRKQLLDNINDISISYLSQLTKIPEKYISMKAIEKTIISSFRKEEILKSKIKNDTNKIKSHGVKKIIKKMSFEDAKEMIKSYLHENNIIIKDVYNYNYDELFEKAKVKWYVLKIEKDKLGFVMKYFDNQYAAYKFKSIIGQKYWKDRDNADRAMKYFIEQDLKLSIDKIPLYITKNNLHIKCSTLYNILYDKRFDNCLFDWINRIYPNKFIEEDFSVGLIRNKFDSMEEQLIDKLLRDRFKNVVYNNRHGDNAVAVLHMQPDWFVFTDNNIYIVEYFGIALSNTKYNQRISDYIERTEEKIEKYKDLPYGKKIFLYPEDIKGEGKGFYEKIDVIV